ncbi:MAG: LTA synthase family protein [Syntrophomonas sp.]
MKEIKIRKESSIRLLWLLVLLIIFIKSIILLISLYSFNTYVILFGIFAFMPILFFLSFSSLFSERGQLFYLFGLNLFISILFFADIIYARAFGHLISIYMIFAKGVTEDLSMSIISLIKWTDFLMFIDLPFIFALALKSKKNIKNIKKIINKNIVEFLIMSILSVGIICYQFTDIENGKGFGLGNLRYQALTMSPIGYHLFDLYKYIYERPIELEPEHTEKIDDWLSNNAKYQVPSDNYAYLEGYLKDKNIIVVQFESLESILIGNSYFGQEIMPNINRILKNSIYFNNIYEQVRDGNSSDAELLFNTSVYPINSGSTFLRFGDNAYNSLPNLLEHEGYTSVAIHGDDKEFWNRNRVFPALGFNRYIAEDEFDNKTNGGMGILDESLFKQSLLEIEKLKEPYYLFIITLTSHMPFNAAADIGCLELPNDDETSRYLQTINYTDRVFGAFYNELGKNGMLDNTVLIIYGDHEGIHKYYDTKLPNNNLKIPFIIHIPGIEGQVIDITGGQVDMMPTVAYLLGIERGEYATGVMGRNLLGNGAGGVLLPDGNLIGRIEDEDHIRESQDIADILIRGNYFNVK